LFNDADRAAVVVGDHADLYPRCRRVDREHCYAAVHGCAICARHRRTV
jgi:hypothetical protein